MKKTLSYLDEAAFCHRCDNFQSDKCRLCENMAKSIKLRNTNRIYRTSYARTINTMNLIEAKNIISKLDPNDLNVIDKLRDVSLGLVHQGDPNFANMQIVDNIRNWKGLVYSQTSKFNMSRKEIQNFIDGKYYFLIGEYDREKHIEIISTVLFNISNKFNSMNDLVILPIGEYITYDIVQNKKESVLYIHMNRQHNKTNDSSKVPKKIMDKLILLLKENRVTTPSSYTGVYDLKYEKNIIRFSKSEIDFVMKILTNQGIKNVNKNSILKYVMEYITSLSKKSSVSVYSKSMKKHYDSRNLLKIENNYVENFTIRPDMSSVIIP